MVFYPSSLEILCSSTLVGVFPDNFDYRYLVNNLVPVKPSLPFSGNPGFGVIRPDGETISCRFNRMGRGPNRTNEKQNYKHLTQYTVEY